MESGKSRWLTARDDKIVAKGKGELQTYWLEVRSLSSYIEGRRASGEFGRRASGASGDSRTYLSTDDGSSCGESMSNLVPSWEQNVPSNGKVVLGERFQRLVDWNVDVLVRLLKRIVAKRQLVKETGEGVREVAEGEMFDLRLGHNVLGQQTDVIVFPRSTRAEAEVTTENSELESQVILQLHEFVTAIATFYQDVSDRNYWTSFCCCFAVTKGSIISEAQKSEPSFPRLSTPFIILRMRAMSLCPLLPGCPDWRLLLSKIKTKT